MTYREQILGIVSKHIPSGSKTVDETLKLEELGLASLDVLEIIFEIEEAFQIQVPYISPGQQVSSANADGHYKDQVETVHDMVNAVERILADSKSVARSVQ